MTKAITEGQQRDIGRLADEAAQAALKAAGLDREAAQRVLMTGGKFKYELGAVLANIFRREKMELDYTYPAGWQLSPMQTQASALAERYGISFNAEYIAGLSQRYAQGGRIVMPDGMEGLALSPKDEVIARLLGDEHADWPAFNRALLALLRRTKQVDPRFRDLTDGSVGPERIWRTLKAQNAYDQLSAGDQGDFIVAAIQTGLLHRRKTVRYARVDFKEDEFGLDGLFVGHVNLGNPGRFTQESLWIDCAGDEVSPPIVVGAADASIWSFGDGELRFHCGWTEGEGWGCGSASGRLPPGVFLGVES